MNTIFSNYRDLGPFCLQLDQQYDQYQSQLQARVRRLAHDVKVATAQLARPREVSPDDLRRSLQSAAAQIRAEEQALTASLAELTAEEDQIIRSLATFEANLDTLLAPAAPSAPPAPALSSKRRSDNRPPDLVHIEQCLDELGGLTGGWDAPSHEAWLQWRQRYPRLPPPALAAKVGEAIPGRTVGDVAHHTEVMADVERLVSERKVFIERWRVNKERAAAERRANAPAPAPAASAATTARMAATRAAAAAWRAQKDAEAAEAARQEAARRAAEKEAAAGRAAAWIREQQQKSQQAAATRLLEEAAAEREAAAVAAKKKEEQTARALEFQRTHQQRVERDLEQSRLHLAQLVSRQVAREDAVLQRSRPASASAGPEVPYDPERLFRPTAAMRARMEDSGPRDAPIVGVNFGRRQLATPAWMKQ